jgi:hypothetical protein
MALGPRDFDLDKRAIRDLAHIATHVEAFEQIQAIATKMGSQPGINRLAERIAAEIPLPVSDVRDLLRGLLNLYNSAQMFRTTVADLMNVITDQFAAKASTPAEQNGLTIWKEKKDRICAAVESLRVDDVFLGSEKAGRLAFAHQNILKEVQILTDVRPVFNEPATTIAQAIISHSLLVEYHDGTETRRIEMALDAADVATLKRLCVRAEQKAVTMKASLIDMSWQTTVFNEWSADRSSGAEKPP